MPTLSVPEVRALPKYTDRDLVERPDEAVRSRATRGARGVTLGILLGAGLWVLILFAFGVIKF